MSDISESQRKIEEIQANYRRRLEATWPISAGSSVLEVGCGQGDMTEVLAARVGPQGRILAVDIADPSYGAPMTLAEATKRIKLRAVGDQIEFRFNFDVLSPNTEFDPDSFDYAILAHSSWYFSSGEQFLATLSRLRPWATRLCFAEWDLEPQSFDQVAHMLAVLIQGQVEAFKSQSTANVRTPFSKGQILNLMSEAGWVVTEETAVETGSLQDADWEIDMCLRNSLAEAQSLKLPEKFVALIESQVRMLRRIARPRGNRTLSSFSILAER